MGRKIKFVLSDLHIGAGTGWATKNLSESFLVDDELVEFLHYIRQESETKNQEVELIINGDFFDFLHVPAVDALTGTTDYSLEAYYNSSEAASIKRLNLIYKAHKAVFAALTNFMQPVAPKRRITIIKGNHDVHFFWPRVKNHLRSLLRASGTRASLLLFAEEFVSREKIYVEHGHQRAEPSNRYPDFLHPIHPDNPTQLNYPVGARFEIDCSYDQADKYPFIHKVKPFNAVIWYALHWDLMLASKLLVHCAGDHQPVLSLNGSSGARPGDHALAAMSDYLVDENRCYQALRQCRQDAGFKREFYTFLSCQFDLAPSPEYGVLAVDDPLDIAQQKHEAQRLSLRQAAEQIAEREGAEVILFGHSHYAIQETLENGAVYINTGCWAEDFSTASPELWETLFNQTYSYGQPPVSLPYARIDYDDDNTPHPQLLDFCKIRQSTTTLSKKVFGWLTQVIGTQ
ncbi:MAG: metallophosphoesterase [Anaerolineae bacterium]|nr:metallophosphoesterase [Anaerolineae bacterium]